MDKCDRLQAAVEIRDHLLAASREDYDELNTMYEDQIVALQRQLSDKADELGQARERERVLREALQRIAARHTVFVRGHYNDSYYMCLECDASAPDEADIWHHTHCAFAVLSDLRFAAAPPSAPEVNIRQSTEAAQRMVDELREARRVDPADLRKPMDM